MQQAGALVVDFVTERPIRLSEVCGLFGVSRRTLDKWIKSGLNVRKIGDKLLYTTREEIQRFSRPVAVAAESPVQSQSELCTADRVAQEARQRFRL